MDPFIYLLPSAVGHKKLAKLFGASSLYRVDLDREEMKAAVLLDTFESKIFQAGKILFQAGEVLSLFELQNGRLIKQTVPEKWSFAGELPDGPVASQLRRLSQIRAFLPVAKMQFCLMHGRVLDDERKTCARFIHLSLRRGKKAAGLGSSRYLRGYDKAHAELCRLLEGKGALSCRNPQQLYERLGLKQQPYTAKPAIPLQDTAAIGESARLIVNTFLKIARQNEAGCIADYDTEFLHDYRVSLRKVRSVLSLFKGIYTPEATDSLKRDFALLMQKTNTLRDLDVYLLDRQRYFELVPPTGHQGLALLFGYFVELRQEEQRKVARLMRSKSYRDEIGRLEGFFKEGSTVGAGPRCNESSMQFASGMVIKRYAKVCKITRGLNEKSKDETIHKLRIQCKKLRYLMEFFSPFFAGKELKSLIVALKSLQDTLGRFNDYSVQQKFLGRVLQAKMDYFGDSRIKVAESVGALTAMLFQLQQKERKLVLRNLSGFDSFEIHATFLQVFNTEESINENNSLLQ